MFFLLMENYQRKSSKPSNYAKVPYEERAKLVKLINEEGLSIGKAARTLSINLSTAKLIWSRFRAKGTFFEKRSDRKARLARLAAEKVSMAKEANYNVRQNSPELSPAIEPVVQTAQPQVFGHKAPYIRSDMNGGPYCYWWGYACFMNPCLNWCQFY